MTSSFKPYAPYALNPAQPVLGARGAGALKLSSPHIPKQPALSLAQMVALLHAKDAKPQRSFLGDLEHGAKFGLNKVAWTFDKLERPAYAIANTYDKGFVNNTNGDGKSHFDLGAALHGAREGFMGRQKMTFGKVFSDHNVLNGHHVLRGLAGLGADVALDPLSYVGAGVAGKGAKAGVELAAQESLKTGYQTGIKAAEAATRAEKFGHYADVLKGAGPDYIHRAAHAAKVSDSLKLISSGHDLTDAARAEVNVARQSAAAEAKLNDARHLHLRLGTMRNNIKLPIAPLPKASQKLGNADIKILSPLANRLGHAFKPGYKNEIEHAQLLARRHQGERMAGEYFDVIRAKFAGMGKLSPKKQREALHYFEKPGKFKAVIKGRDGKYVLNPHHIARAIKAGLSEDQIKFVQAMHDTGEFFAARHREYGTEFEHLGAKGKLYVPHIVTKTGEGVTDAMLKGTNLLTKKGFQKGRLADLSIKELHDLHAAGAFTHTVETDPFKLMAMHGRSVANQHADQILINYMKHTLGVPSKLVDHGAMLLSKTKHAAVLEAAAKHAPWDEQHHLDAMQELTDRHEIQAQQRYSATLASNHAAIKHHLEVEPWKQTTQATVARISQRSLDAKHTLTSEVQQIRARTYKPLVKELRPLKNAKAQHFRALKGFERKASALMKEQEALAKGTIKNPDYNAATMRKVDQLKNADGHALHFPHEVADAMERLKKVMKEDDPTLGALAEGYRKYLGKWKLGVTSINPSYATRNTLSDYWNMYLSGVPVHAIPVYAAKAAKVQRDAKIAAEIIAKGGKLSGAQSHAISVMLDGYDSGILSGLFAGDVQQVSNLLEHANTKLSLLQRGHLVKLVTKASMDINRNRENWGRLTHYMYRLSIGDSAVRAAEKVKEAHFDYEDLTKFEQQRMKLVAPFYTWSRKNIPFQLKSLVESPGQYAAFPQALQEADPGGKDGIIPNYMNDGMYAKIGGKFYNPMIGVSDLHNATNPVDLVKSLLSPFVKTPVELLTNKNMLTGAPIKDPQGYDRNPVRGGLAADLLSLIPGANVGETGRKNANGKMVHGVGADPRLSYLLGQTPLTNLLFNQGSKIKGEVSPENQHRATLAWLTGINGTSVNEKQQQEFALLHFQKDVLPALMKNYRAHGVIPAAAIKKLSPNEQLIAEVLFKSLGRGN